MFGKQRDHRTYTTLPLLHGENSGEQTKGTRPGVTYLAGSSLMGGYKGLSEL